LITLSGQPRAGSLRMKKALAVTPPPQEISNPPLPIASPISGKEDRCLGHAL
jgi:hypothetical protein